MFGGTHRFDELAAEDAKALMDHSVTRSFPKNTVLIHEGDETDSLYVILNGRAKVFASDEDGGEVILNLLGPGEYFGELALVDDAPRSASVVTVEPSKLAIISRAAFREVLAKHPDVAFNLIREMARRIRTLTENVKGLALMDVYGRIARVLIEMAEPEGDMKVIGQRLTHQELANMVGSSREMVSRIMKELTNGGYLSVEKNRMLIHKKLPARW